MPKATRQTQRVAFATIQKKGVKQLIGEYLTKTTPDHYKTMYLDGFEPWQILEAKRKEMKSNFFNGDTDYEINITSEIEIK